jgi:LuxR family maltose regulon positive regulatory protein
MEVGKRLEDEELIITASVLLARIKYAQGEVLVAQRLLSGLSDAFQAKKWSRQFREVRAFQALIALETGDLAAVERWYVNANQRGEFVPLIQQEYETLITARMLMLKGEPDGAADLLHSWRAKANAQERFGNEVGILVIQALAYYASRKIPQAREIILQALMKAQPEGYRRIFVDGGDSMAALLREVLPQLTDRALRAYAQELLQAIDQKRPEPSDSLVSSQLSQQEQRVLRLLGAGLSNPEIAEELVVSINTIKTQVKSIYRKLNVTNRDEAREAAHHLNLR